LQRHGALDRLSSDVLRVVGAPETWQQRVLAAVWSGGRRCFATATTAGALHRFDGYEVGRLPIEVILPETHRSFEWRDTKVHHSKWLHDDETVIIDGIPCVDAVHAWLTLCAYQPQYLVEEALDSAERDGVIDRVLLLDRLAKWRESGRNGVINAATILEGREAVGATPHTKLERRLLRVLSDAGIRVPVCQYWVIRPDGSDAYIDAAWPEIRYGAEVDGHGSHATRRQRAKDNVRQNALLMKDFELSRFTWEQVDKQPGYVAATIRDTIRARAPKFGIDPRTYFEGRLFVP
jgi:hypothetical protein